MLAEPAERPDSAERRPLERRPLAVDEIRDPLLEVLRELVRLRLRQSTRADGCLQLFVRRGRHGVDESADALVLVLGDLRERLAARELRAQLRLGQAEVARRGVELAEHPEPVAVMAEPAEAEAEREVAGVDAGLQRIALLLRQLARRDRGVDLLLHGVLQRVRERARADAQLLRRVVDDGLARVPV